jgi:hypothetical protein
MCIVDGVNRMAMDVKKDREAQQENRKYLIFGVQR